MSASVNYANGVATLTPTSALAANTTYTATVKGGSTGVKDLAGNALAADFTWSFTTAAPPTCPCSIWSTTRRPVLCQRPRRVELGVKFRADSSGYITRTKFYKYSRTPAPMSAVSGRPSGTLLGTLTFTSETASGWQQASFATPVAITAGDDLRGFVSHQHRSSTPPPTMDLRRRRQRPAARLE